MRAAAALGPLLRSAWLRRGLLACLLLPVALCLRGLIALRRGLYRVGLFGAFRASVPVIVVGNVVAGGAGKTPVVMALLRHLASSGVRAGVVSRGYGRTTTDCREVRPDDPAAVAGDEPLLLRQLCGAPVFVAARRTDAVRALLGAYPNTQIIVCDDGLQHLALKRDIEICVFDERGVGNGWLLPAGPLREPWPRPVDLVLVRPGTPPSIAGWQVDRALGPMLTDARGQTRPLMALRGQPVCAVAATARPEEFFNMLREQGLTLAQTFALPDHHGYDDVSLPAGLTLVCTRKDAVKLWTSRPDAWAVDLDIRIDDKFWVAFDRAVGRALSSPHGSPTA